MNFTLWNFKARKISCVLKFEILIHAEEFCTAKFKILKSKFRALKFYALKFIILKFCSQNFKRLKFEILPHLEIYNLKVFKFNATAKRSSTYQSPCALEGATNSSIILPGSQ